MTQKISRRALLGGTAFTAAAAVIGISPPVAQASKPVAITKVRESLTYTSGASYLHDLITDKIGEATNAAKERLRRHVIDVETNGELRKLAQVDENETGDALKFVPPLDLMKDIKSYPRPYVDSIVTQYLPYRTDSINIPKILGRLDPSEFTGPKVWPLEHDRYVTAPVRKIAGRQAIATTLLNTALSFDKVVIRDLTSDYNSKLTRQVISGSGANGEVLGVDSTPGIQTVEAKSLHWSNARKGYLRDQGKAFTPIWNAISEAQQYVHTHRYLPPTCIVMHPRRYEAFVDTGFKGDQILLMTPVLEIEMPTNYGVNRDEDAIHVIRAEDFSLWESGPRLGVWPDYEEGLIQLELYTGLAFSAARYPQSVACITGTALSAKFLPRQ